MTEEDNTGQEPGNAGTFKQYTVEVEIVPTPSPIKEHKPNGNGSGPTPKAAPPQADDSLTDSDEYSTPPVHPLDFRTDEQMGLPNEDDDLVAIVGEARPDFSGEVVSLGTPDNVEQVTTRDMEEARSSGQLSLDDDSPTDEALQIGQQRNYYSMLVICPLTDKVEPELVHVDLGIGNLSNSGSYVAITLAYSIDDAIAEWECRPERNKDQVKYDGVLIMGSIQAARDRLVKEGLITNSDSGSPVYMLVKGEYDVGEEYLIADVQPTDNLLERAYLARELPNKEDEQIRVEIMQTSDELYPNDPVQFQDHVLPAANFHHQTVEDNQSE